MSDLSATTIARFLQENPDFFVNHADIFAMLTVPHPYQHRAISLGERQVMVLRDKVRLLEARLAELIREAQRNEAIGKQYTQWCQRLLDSDLVCQPARHITDTLIAQFGLQDAALRVWPPADGEGNDASDAAPVSADIRRYAESLTTPYCGNDATQAGLAPIFAWLGQVPASFALIALRRDPQAAAFGLLVLGVDDPQRFVAGMATDFLADIGQLASAALGRA